MAVGSEDTWGGKRDYKTSPDLVMFQHGCEIFGLRVLRGYGLLERTDGWNLG